jgi:3-oxoacyl-[acyl-carrier protein] reductase
LPSASRVSSKFSLEQTLQTGAAALGLALTAHQQQALLKYLELLQRWNSTYNLTAVRDPQEQLKLHVLDCLTVVPWFLARAPKQVLDVGCGGGILADAMARRGAEVLGIDLATKSLRVAQLHALEAQTPNVVYREVSAETLAAEGVNVSICARNAGEVEATVAALKARGVKVHGAALDVADGAALKAWVDASAAAFGGVDIAVANVSALAIGQDEASWQKEFEVDMMGTVRLVNAAMPYLEKSGKGSIVAVSSVSGREVDFAAGPYGTFKAALIHYVQGLAFQLAGKGIRANTISPGNTYFPGGVWEQIKNGNPALYAQALALNPTGRMGTPQEMANGAVFLASPAASFITGTNLVIDGALTRGVQF